MSDLQERARRFVDELLIPNEELAELNGGKIPNELRERIKRESIEAGLSGGLHAREHGGQGWTKTEWCLVAEQLGRSTNALSWHMPTAYNVLANGTPEQIERYLRPALRGELHDAYAVTEAGAGSDPSMIETTARRTDSGWVIGGEKWFVTYGDVAAVYIVMAKALADGRELPTLFLVDAGLDGITVVDDPPFTHSYPHGRPPDDPLRRRRGRRGRGDRRARGRRRPSAGLVHRGAPGDRRAGSGVDVAADRGDHRLGSRARAGRQPDHGLPGRVLPAGRLGSRRRGGAAAGARSGAAG
jgi:hypothetical protein